MIQSLSRSWSIAQQSWSLLMRDKELLLFPLISGIAVVVVLASLAIPGFALGAFTAARWGVPVFVPAFAFYFVSSMIVIFFNSAMVSAIHERMEGGDPTLASGLRGALRHLGPILGYAAISATVGLLLRMLRERGGLAGRIVALFGGLGWALATYVAIPVLVVEGIGPIRAIQRSSSLIRRTWGHQLAGHVGFGAVQLLAVLLVLAVCVPLVIVSLQAGLWPLALAVGVCGALALVGTTVVFAALTTVYRTAVYRYSVTGETREFDLELLGA